MKRQLLEILECPRCKAPVSVTATEETAVEVRAGHLVCCGKEPHRYAIEDGILRTVSGFDHEAVRKEIEYENSTYKGSDRLTDPDTIAGFPDTLAELWPHTCNFGPDFRVLIDHLSIKKGDWVLDVGTGPCWSTRLLAERGANAIALDVNEANFYGLKTADILFEKHGVFFERILESMTSLPFKDASIDAITFNASFHHTPDLEATLKECRRVLKPGGLIAMVNEEFSSLRQRLFNEETVTDTGSHHTIAYADFEESVKANGFSVKYHVAHHVRQKLEEKLSSVVGEIVVRTMENFPLTLKQMNSALILLHKLPLAGEGPKKKDLAESFAS